MTTTTDDKSFMQLAIPRLDVHYEHWALLMENLLRSKEYWNLVETGIPQLPADANQEQVKAVEDAKLKDLKVKNYLYQAIDRRTIETIMNKGTAKEIWDSLKIKHQGSTKVKKAQLHALRREFELLGMKEEEGVKEYVERMLAIANKMQAHGDKIDESGVVEKILRLMTAKFGYVVCSIMEAHDISTLSVDELQASLLVHELRINEYKGKGEEEQALKATVPSRGGFRGRGRSTEVGEEARTQARNQSSVTNARDMDIIRMNVQAGKKMQTSLNVRKMRNYS